MEDRLCEQIVKQVDVILKLKVRFKRLVDVFIEHETLCDKRVDSLVANLPRDSVDQKSVLNNIELCNARIPLEFLSVEHFDEDLNKMVQLGNTQEVEMSMEVEQFDLMVCYRFRQRLHKNVHYQRGHIRLVKESEVDVRCNFERVIHNTELEQFDELIPCDLR